MRRGAAGDRRDRPGPADPAAGGVRPLTGQRCAALGDAAADHRVEVGRCARTPSRWRRGAVPRARSGSPARAPRRRRRSARAARAARGRAGRRTHLGGGAQRAGAGVEQRALQAVPGRPPARGPAAPRCAAPAPAARRARRRPPAAPAPGRARRAGRRRRAAAWCRRPAPRRSGSGWRGGRPSRGGWRRRRCRPRPAAATVASYAARLPNELRRPGDREAGVPRACGSWRSRCRALPVRRAARQREQQRQVGAQPVEHLHGELGVVHRRRARGSRR